MLYYLLTVIIVVSLMMSISLNAEQHVVYGQLQCENGANCTGSGHELFLPLPSGEEAIDEATNDGNELAIQGEGREKDLGERMNNDENAGQNENPLILPFP